MRGDNGRRNVSNEKPARVRSLISSNLNGGYGWTGNTDHGGTIMVCPPCAKVRGYEQSDFIEGVELAGSTAMLGVVSEGAKTLTF